jgi:hypothetical protein
MSWIHFLWDSRVGADGQYLYVTLGKFASQFGHCAKLSGTHGRKVSRVREKNAPAVAEPFVKVDCSFGRFGREVGSQVA